MRSILVAALVVMSLIPALSDAQEPARTPWGDPDLAGTWLSANTDALPFQRPLDDGDDDILRELVEGGVIERVVLRDRFPASPFQAELVAEARRNTLAAWRGTGAFRGTLIVDPPDGRMPPLTAAGRQRSDTAWRTSDSGGPWTRASDLGPVERCISRGVIGSMLPSLDYHGVQLVQAPGVVVIRHESMHHARVIWLDARPPLSPRIRGYMGDGRGFWDDDTLVVRSTNFNGRTGARAHGNELPMSDRLQLVERFTRTGADTMVYEVTVDDPGTWDAPWRAAFALARDARYVMSEYACHEGNYALRNILSAARAVRSAGPLGPERPPD